MTRLFATAGLTLVTGLLCAQAPAPTPAFEVASIRLANPPTPEARRSGQFFQGTKIDAARLDFGYVTIYDLLPWAFHVKQYQIVAPSWTREARWNIQATLPSGTSERQAPDMMKSLLVDRFKLTYHVEKRDQPVWELTVAAGGPKLEKPKPGDEFKEWDGSFPGFRFAGGLLQNNQVISGRIMDQPNCNMRWEFLPLTMNTFSNALTLFLNRPVVDETALPGEYRLALDINVDTMTAINENMAASMALPAPGGGGGGRGRAAGGDDGGGRGQAPRGPAQGLAQCLEAAAGSPGSTAMLFTAVQKLGLKLQQGRAAIDTIVIDHLERTPTEN